MLSPPLPLAWADRIFDRLKATYGSQKLGAMFGDADPDEVRRTWARALGKFQPATIGSALDGLAADGGAWPPTLPEFVGRCIAIESRPGFKLALPVPARKPEEIRQGAEQLARIREMLRGAVKRVPV